MPNNHQKPSLVSTVSMNQQVKQYSNPLVKRHSSTYRRMDKNVKKITKTRCIEKDCQPYEIVMKQPFKLWGKLIERVQWSD